MKYIGLQKQINRNNNMSVLLLLAFPTLILAGVFAFTLYATADKTYGIQWDESVQMFIEVIPMVLIGVAIWFVIAYFANSKMINLAAGSHTLERRDNKRVYNLTENLCMSVGMPMPKLRVIDSPALNAFASGIKEDNYSVTLTTGIIETLNDEELEGVIAHELTHIRNKDVRLLVVSIIFVGIFSFVAQIAYRSLWYGSLGRSRRRNDKDSGGGAIIIIIIIAFIAYLLSVVFKLALSRKREYLADSGAVEMTRKPWALASALRKISGNSDIESITNQDVKEMFIDNSPPKNGNHNMNLMESISSFFSTHPPIEKRIKFLEQL